MNKRIFKYLVFLYLLIAYAINASTNFNGATGLIFIPTADALKYKECNFGFDYILTSQEETRNWKYKVNMGIYENLELGFSGGKFPDEGVFVNLKYYLMSTQERYPLKIAIGSESLTAKNATNIYMISSKRFNPALAGHFGFNAMLDDKIEPGIMLGVSYFITEIVELISDVHEQSNEYKINLGATIHYNQYATLKIALVDTLNLDEPQIIVGIVHKNYL